MRALKTLEKSFPQSPEVVFEKLKKIVTEKPYTLTTVDEDAQRIEFESGGGATSMGHFVFAAELASTGEGTSVSLNVHTGESTPKAILDGWKNKIAGDKLLKRLEAAV